MAWIKFILAIHLTVTKIFYKPKSNLSTTFTDFEYDNFADETSSDSDSKYEDLFLWQYDSPYDVREIEQKNELTTDVKREDHWLRECS